MPYLVKADLKTHLYDEITDEITRADDEIVATAISQAIAEAKSYLGRYDLLKLFGNDTTAPEVVDENLKSRVKDVAVWRLVRLSNPNISIELAKTNYDDAITWLRDIQKGIAEPDGWIYKIDDTETKYNENDQVQWHSNHKRHQHY